MTNYKLLLIFVYEIWCGLDCVITLNTFPIAICLVIAIDITIIIFPDCHFGVNLTFSNYLFYIFLIDLFLCIISLLLFLCIISLLLF